MSTTPVVHPEHLAGVTEIAERLAVGRSTVCSWHSRAEHNGFPAPLATLAAGYVWDIRDVETWRAEFVPRRGNRDRRAAARAAA